MLSQAVFPQLEPADPTTSATLTANLELKKLVLEAEALFTQEKLADALKSYEKINDKYPEEAWVKYRLSVIYQRSNYDYFREKENEIPSQQLNVLLKSISLAEQAVALQPQNHIYLIHLAQLQANNKPHKAANLYHQAMLLQPRSSSIYGLAAEHAAKQIRYQLLNENPPTTTTNKQTAISPFTDTLIHIAQRYKNQFGINATYVEMMVYAYSRMPNKEAEKNALLADWNKSQQLTNNPVNSTNETATNTAAPKKNPYPKYRKEYTNRNLHSTAHGCITYQPCQIKAKKPFNPSQCSKKIIPTSIGPFQKITIPITPATRHPNTPSFGPPPCS